MKRIEALCVKEIAAILNISVHTVYDKFVGEKLGPPFIWVAGQIRFPVDEFNKWVKNGGTPGGKRKPQKCSASQ